MLVDLLKRMSVQLSKEKRLKERKKSKYFARKKRNDSRNCQVDSHQRKDFLSLFILKTWFSRAQKNFNTVKYCEIFKMAFSKTAYEFNQGLRLPVTVF